jgi:hypothetical protein
MKYSPSIIGLASVAAARKANQIHVIWSPHLEELTGTQFDKIKPCFDELYAYYEESIKGSVLKK